MKSFTRVVRNMPGRLLAPPQGEYDIHCPRCRRSFSLELTAGFNYWQCPRCGIRAKLLLATVRAKRGKKESFLWREYSVRYIDSSGEGLLQFRSKRLEDIELRPRDVMIVVFRGRISTKLGKTEYSKKPQGIYNCTIGEYYQIKPHI